MKKKIVFGMMLTLLSSILTVKFNVQAVNASLTIYIRDDGSIDPSTAPIQTIDNVTYFFTADINGSIIVERDNIIIDGAGYTLQGIGDYTSVGILLQDRSNITVKNMKITAFGYGIYLDLSANSTVSENNITENNAYGIISGRPQTI